MLRKYSQVFAGGTFQHLYGELEPYLKLEKESKLAQACDSVSSAPTFGHDEKRSPMVHYNRQGRNRRDPGQVKREGRTKNVRFSN